MRFISRSNALGRLHYVTSRSALHLTNSPTGRRAAETDDECVYDSATSCFERRLDYDSTTSERCRSASSVCSRLRRDWLPWWALRKKSHRQKILLQQPSPWTTRRRQWTPEGENCRRRTLSTVSKIHKKITLRDIKWQRLKQLSFCYFVISVGLHA